MGVSDTREGPTSKDLEAVLDAITRLPERERLVLVLIYFEGLTAHEIAEVLGVTTARAQTLLRQALARMRSHLYGPTG
jgi:RNA polymerase sigma factor for flagellar operon FliA